MSQPCFIFSGGGTGGHLFPGIAVANAVRAKLPDARIIFLTTQRQLDRDLLVRTDFEQIEQPVRPMSSRPWHWPGFGLAWRSSVAIAAKTIQKTQPTAILGLGGYAAAPPIVAGKKANVFTAILNPDAIPGKANRYLGRVADLVVAQWDATRKHFSPATDVRVLGCPIRAEFESADPTIAMREFELVPTRPMLLVTGASQGARTVNDALIACWPKFFAKNPQWQLVHLTGTSEHDRVQAAYARAESDLEDEKVDVARFRASTRVVAFAHRMASVIAASSLVVSRAGASTLAELTRLGKPSVLFPYPYHKDRHQHANAHVLVERGAAVLLDDTRDGARNGAILAPVLEQVARKNVHDVMAECAALMGKPACAEKVAELLIERGG